MGIEPKFREWDGNGSLILFVASLNQHRRHLDAGQRAMIAIEIEKGLAQENKVGRPAKETEKDGNISVISGESRAQAAAIIGTNPHYVTDAKKVVEQAPELKPLVMDRTISLPDAKKLASEDEETQLL